MDTFEFWDCSIDNNIKKESEIFTSKYAQSEILLNVPDKRFKLKHPSNTTSNERSIYPSIESQLIKQQQQTIHQQQQQAANADLLKLNLSNKKELKKKLLNFDINRNFEDIYWLSLKEKQIKSTSSTTSFPPIFDKSFFKPKHGMNNYQLIKFENRYHQQLLQQTQQQHQNKPANNNGKKEKKFSVTDSISRTAAVLVDLNRQSLSSLHAMPIVNENFRNRYFENYLHNRKISVGHSGNGGGGPSSAKGNRKKSANTNQSNTDSNNNNNNINKEVNNNIKQNEGHSNKHNDTITSLNTIYFKPNFNLAENASSFDSDDDKSTGSPIGKSDHQSDTYPLSSLKQANHFHHNPNRYDLRRQQKKNISKRNESETLTPSIDDNSKVAKDDLQFQFRLKPLTESSLLFTPTDDHNDSHLSHSSQTPTPKTRNSKRDSGIRAPKQSIQDTFESLSKKINESLPSSNSKTKLKTLNQYGREIKMDDESHTLYPAATTNLSLTANIPAATPQPSFKKPKPIIDVKSRKQSSMEAQQKNETLMINNKKNVLTISDLKPKTDANGHHFAAAEDFNYLRVESPHKLGKAAGDCYKFIATSSVQVNSSNSFKNTNIKNQFDSFQSNFYENTNTKSSINKTT